MVQMCGGCLYIPTVLVIGSLCGLYFHPCGLSAICAQPPLHRQQRDRLQQFSWRPRPPSLLSPEQEREITRNLKKYSRRYEEEDATLGQEEDVKLKEERERLMAEWTRCGAGWVGVEVGARLPGAQVGGEQAGVCGGARGGDAVAAGRPVQRAWCGGSSSRVVHCVVHRRESTQSARCRSTRWWKSKRSRSRVAEGKYCVGCKSSQHHI